MLRDHGQVKKYFHDVEGYNGRLDSIQAGFLNAKLPYLAGWNKLRRDRAAEYNRLLSRNQALIVPFEPEWSRSVYHLYVIRTGNRDGLIEDLKSKGIGTGIHYPIPLHLQKPYAFLNYTREDLPVASRVALEIVSLPMFPQLATEQQARVADEIRVFTTKSSLAEAENEKAFIPLAQQTV